MITELQAHLSNYEIKPITKENYMQVMGVYQSNQEFFLLTEGKEATANDCFANIDAMPPNFNKDNKFYIGLWKDGQAIALLDFLEGYPTHESVYIGLLLIHGALHGKRLGSKIVQTLLEVSQEIGFKSARLGVLCNNTKALTFWERMGFMKTGESTVDVGGNSLKAVTMSYCMRT